MSAALTGGIGGGGEGTAGGGAVGTAEAGKGCSESEVLGAGSDSVRMEEGSAERGETGWYSGADEAVVPVEFPASQLMARKIDIHATPPRGKKPATSWQFISLAADTMARLFQLSLFLTNVCAETDGATQPGRAKNLSGGRLRCHAVDRNGFAQHLQAAGGLRRCPVASRPHTVDASAAQWSVRSTCV